MDRLDLVARLDGSLSDRNRGEPAAVKEEGPWEHA